ncbi:MAG: DUF2254 domain-containing protein [Bdellovibrionales bacterium]
MASILFWWRRLSKSLSARAGAFAVFALLSAFASFWLAPLVPDGWTEILGHEALLEILKIVASSMLVVATFSLATLVNAYAAASDGVTPRAARLLLQDESSQNSISIFLGAFIFSIVAIVAVTTGFYGPREKVVIFLLTAGLIAAIVWTLIRWIERLSRLGRVHDTIVHIEKSTESALLRLAESPTYGCRDHSEFPVEDWRVHSSKAGFIQNISFRSLQAKAAREDLQIKVQVPPGSFVVPGQAILSICGKSTKELAEGFEESFEIETCRSHDEDPRFGFVTLGEVASRALSPALNDPGTAIDVIYSSVRILCKWAATPKRESYQFDRLFIRPWNVAKVLDDLFQPLSRDGAGHIEVVIHMLRGLGHISKMGDGDLAQAASCYIQLVKARALSSLPDDFDRNLLAQFRLEDQNRILA